MDLNGNIEGASPLADLSGLKIKTIRTRPELFQAEFENILHATEKYLAGKPSKRLAPFTLQWIKKLHQEMFGDVWEWAGGVRNTELSHGWCARIYQIEPQLHNMLEDLKVWQTHMIPIEQAAYLHHRAVQIHPFLNGNGRWARLLSNIWLRQSGKGLVLWPEQIIAKTSVIRDRYLHAIHKADKGDMVELIALHKEYWKEKLL